MTPQPRVLRLSSIAGALSLRLSQSLWGSYWMTHSMGWFSLRNSSVFLCHKFYSIAHLIHSSHFIRPHAGESGLIKWHPNLASILHNRGFMSSLTQELRISCLVLQTSFVVLAWFLANRIKRISGWDRRNLRNCCYVGSLWWTEESEVTVGELSSHSVF